MNKGLYSSKSSEWATPRSLFLDIQYEFGLEVDVCATHENTQLPSYFTREQDGLAHDWTGLRCWMNPPYGREIGKWVEKAATGGASIVVALLPARTDTKWFHDHIYGKAEIRFLKGRVHFNDAGPAPFPSMVVIWKHSHG